MIGDINEQLINVYTQVRDNPHDVIRFMKSLDSIECTSDRYYEVRSILNEMITNRTLSAESASIFIFVNKHCFNGLYRVNKSGEFNVPYNGRFNGSSVDENNLIMISNYLRSHDIEILNSDFEETCSSAKSGDFIYFDSPYIPITDTAKFVNYQKDGFSLDSHKRLASLVKELDRRGCFVLISNNDVPLVYDLYANFDIIKVDAKRSINRCGDKRHGKEVLIRNYSIKDNRLF